MQGPPTAFQDFRNAFVSFLSQRYGYKGAVGCAPASSAANAQNVLNTRSAALRKQKKNVVETGWTGPAAVATASTAAHLPAPQAKQAATASGGASAGSSGGASSGSSELSGILAAVFGTGGATGSGGAATPGAKSNTGGAAGHAGSTGTTGGAPNQAGVGQVASTLATVFSNQSSVSGDAGGQSAPGAKSSEGLGSAQAQNTKLVVYGCGRQDAQVACVTELTNQNEKDTLVQSAAVWKDTFIVDDRGDRHQRSNGFFLNIDGDQRSQLDISYGKSARFILMFDGVPVKVQKVALRSTAGALDVEDIGLVAPSADAQKH